MYKDIDEMYKDTDDEVYKNTDEDIYASDIDVRDFRELNRYIRKYKKKQTNSSRYSKKDKYFFYARLGEVINNGIKYFGGYRKEVLRHNTIHSAKFICPKCDELFRANTKKIQDGSIKDCGCTK